MVIKMTKVDIISGDQNSKSDGKDTMNPKIHGNLIKNYGTIQHSLNIANKMVSDIQSHMMQIKPIYNTSFDIDLMTVIFSHFPNTTVQEFLVGSTPTVSMLTTICQILGGSVTLRHNQSSLIPCIRTNSLSAVFSIIRSSIFFTITISYVQFRT